MNPKGRASLRPLTVVTVALFVAYFFGLGLEAAAVLCALWYAANVLLRPVATGSAKAGTAGLTLRETQPK